MFASLFSFCRIVVGFIFVFALWGIGMWCNQLGMHPDATIMEFIMFEFLAIVPILCLLLLGFMAGRKKDKQPIKEIRGMHYEIKRIKQEMIDFIDRPDRVKYWNRIYTWIYHNDKDVYNWISKNPAWVQEHWMVRGVEIDEDVCRFAMNKDAEKVLEQFYQQASVSEEKVTAFGQTKWVKTFLVRGPQGETNKRFMEWYSHV